MSARVPPLFLLDTNVLSELVRPRPDSHVIAWMESHSSLDLFVSVLSLGEIQRGIALMTKGSRRRALEDWAESEIPRAFSERVLPVDAAVAKSWGVLDAAARRAGRPLDVVDGLLLASAHTHGLTFVTRNRADCDGRGVPVMDPFAAGT